MRFIPISITLFSIVTFLICPSIISSNDQVICQTWRRQGNGQSGSDPEQCKGNTSECAIKIHLADFGNLMSIDAFCPTGKDVQCSKEMQMSKNCSSQFIKGSGDAVVCCCKESECNSIGNLTSIAEAIETKHTHLHGKLIIYTEKMNQSWTGTVKPLTTTTPMTISTENASAIITDNNTTTIIENASTTMTDNTTTNTENATTTIKDSFATISTENASTTISEDSATTSIITSSIKQESVSINTTEQATSMTQTATTLSNEFKCHNYRDGATNTSNAQPCPQNSCFITVHWSRMNDGEKVQYGWCDTKNLTRWISQNPHHDNTSIHGFNCIYSLDVGHMFVTHVMNEMMAPNYTMVKTSALCVCQTSLCNEQNHDQISVMKTNAEKQWMIEQGEKMKRGNMTEKDEENKNTSQQPAQVNGTAGKSMATAKYKQDGIQLLLLAGLLMATMVLLSADGFQHFTH